MTTKTWNGSNDSFSNPAAWSPAGAPQPGDTALINAGTVTVADATLGGLLIQLNASARGGPALRLRDSTVAAGSTVAAAANAGLVALDAAGTVVNAGLISFTGAATARFTTTLTDTGGGQPALLRNTGSIAAIDASANVVASAAGQAIENNGAISVWNPSHGAQFAVFGPDITGTGIILIDGYARAELVQGVSAGQTVQFLNNGVGRSALQIDRPANFQGTVAGFAATDTITLREAPFTSFHYDMTGPSGGVLTLEGATVTRLHFEGAYQTSDFHLAFNDFGQGQSLTQITTSQAAGSQAFHITDATLQQATTDAGSAYTGPLDYLQREFIWSSPDAVAISSDVDNVFLHGGAAGDALAVHGGRNVLDGGGGSNFLVGGVGPGSEDTFFVDGRGGVETWSTIVNFHAGDAATIFGFHPGLSTMPYTASDGADGFKGLTIHSELGGPGTGVNGSITFAGIDQATADAHFSITTGTLLPGTAGAIDYLLIQYNH